jgi:hypothetical protein
MNVTARQDGRSVASRSLFAAAVVIAGILASVAMAEAHGHGNPHGNPHGNSGKHGYYDSRPVPRVITVDHQAFYSPYVSGRIYYAPHHHYHARYLFPVFVGGAVQYHPYYYCGGTLFVNSAVALPHLAIGFDYSSPGGLYLSGYYQQPYVQQHEHHYYDRDYDPDEDQDD